MIEEKWFPVQGEHGSERDATGAILRHWQRPAGRVPWAVAAKAYEVYSRKFGKEQSLETLAARGGFSWGEIVWLLAGARDDNATLDLAEPDATKMDRG